ncbi:MAG: serine hydrolase [Bacteroidales bacterium]|nr:serine hydrolase [Bacteroidales bacterium]
MKKMLIIVFTILLVLPAIAQKKSQDINSRLKGIDKELREVLETWKAPGFAVAVVEKNKIIYAKGFGYRDFKNKISVTPNTLFAIGSCTKAFTTSLIGLLESENKISFDERPGEYIPGFKFYNQEMNNSITIKDMMSHRTGLPRHDFSWYLFPANSKDSLLQRVAFHEPFTGVREKWYYNNFMYLAQGVIIEKVTGISWEDNVSEKLFEPLKMSRSNLYIDELEKSEDIAFGYELKNDSIIQKTDYYNIAGMSPAGSINSSVNEMSNWLITWINGGKFNDKEILPATFVNQAMSSQMVVSGSVPGKEHPDLHLSNYGYGWFISSYKGHYRVQHGGNIDGFSANVCFFPGDSIGIVVLTNQNGSAIPSVVRNIIADRVLNESSTDWNKELKEREEKAAREQNEAKSESVSNRKSGTKPSHILEEYTGTYTHSGYGSFDLLVERDSLFAQFPLMKFWLRHHHYDIFVPFEVEKSGIDTTETSELRFNFTTNNSGEIASLQVKMEAALDPVKFKRTPDLIALDKEILEKYVGEYELSGIPLKIYMKGDKTLILFIQGQPEYELFATGRYNFSIKALEGYKLEFIEGEKEAIIEVLFIQPNGTFKAKRK